jgi:hypothetical protein
MQCRQASCFVENNHDTTLEEGQQHLTASQAIIAYNKSNLHVNQCCFTPEGVHQATFKIRENMGGKEVTHELPRGAEDTLQLGEKFMDVLKENIILTVAVSKFNDLCLGDIKFFACLLGMVNLDTCWCLHCERVQGEFGSGQFDPNKVRTKGNLKKCLLAFRQIIKDAQDNNAKTTPKNCLGVNSCPLQNIDPDKLMLSALHCKIGQINKCNADAGKWALFYVEKLEPNQQAI